MTQREEFIILKIHLARNHFVKGTSINILMFSLENPARNIPIKHIIPEI